MIICRASGRPTFENPWQQTAAAAAAAAAAAEAVAAERVVYPTTHAIPLARARKLHTYASTHTERKRKYQHSTCTKQKKQEQHNDYWQQQQNRLNSSSSSTQQRWRRGSVDGQIRASEPPIVRLMTPYFGGCVLTYASARSVHTHKANEGFSTLHTAEATAAQRLLAAAAATDRPNSSSSNTQQRRRRGSGGDHLRASEPLIVLSMTPCLGGCVLFGSVTCALCCLSAVLRHVCSALFVGCHLL